MYLESHEEAEIVSIAIDIAIQAVAKTIEQDPDNLNDQEYWEEKISQWKQIVQSIQVHRPKTLDG